MAKLRVFIASCVVNALLGALSAAPTTAQAQSRPHASVHHPVTTSSAQAQAAFDTGLLDYYAYSVQAAQAEFYRAADLDHHLAMAYWGIAMSDAPNLNVDPTDDREQQAAEAIDQAKSLERYASPERAYIEAAAQRFSDDPKTDRAALLRKYFSAMQRLSEKYPADPDAAALFGEAALYVAVAGYGNIDTMSDAQRAGYASRASALLPYFESIYARYPTHIGVLHFFIHTADFAGRQQAALQAARALAAFDFAPENSHLTHMPGHIFLKLGLYKEAEDVASRSIAMDYADYACCSPTYYSATRYYHDHNMSFLLYALTELGATQDALKAATVDGNDVFLARQLVADRQWKRVLDIPFTKGASATITFARGLAFAEQGDVQSTRQTLREMPVPPADSPSFAAIVEAMKLTLQACIATLMHDDARSLQLLRQASASATRGDTIGASEYPQLYYYSPHLALARVAQQLGDSATARKAYDAELAASPQSPAALAGLAELTRVVSGTHAR